MKLAKLVSIGIALLLIQACSHPIDIVGVGDVVTDQGGTGTRSCTWEDDRASPVPGNCAKNFVTGTRFDVASDEYTLDPEDYQEVYTAVPRPGWMFDSWVNCAIDGFGTESGNTCTFDVPAATVRAGWIKTMPPLTAVFTHPPTGCPCVDQYPSMLEGLSYDMENWLERHPNPLLSQCQDLLGGYSATSLPASCISDGPTRTPCPERQPARFFAIGEITRGDLPVDGGRCSIVIDNSPTEGIDGQVVDVSELTAEQLSDCQQQLAIIRGIDPLQVCDTP